MSNPELLALLTPHGSPTMGRGGIPRITPQDVAAAMHRLSQIESELLLVKYCMHKPVGLWAEFFQWVMAQPWDAKKGQRDIFTRMAIADYVSPGKCNRCGGVGTFMFGTKVLECGSCEGTGNKRPSERTQAKMLEVSRHEWRTRWATRWDAAARELRRVEYEATSKIESL